MEFAPGMRTIIRDEEWMVKKIETNSLGNKALYCVGISPLVKDKEAIFLTDLEEIQIVNPAEVKLVPDHSARFRRSLLYLESQWRQKIPTDANIHIGYKAAMDPMPYQLDPAKQSLQRPRQRILIADTVGLGKTLEAGILMSELITRGKGKRILVVTVKSMMTQFQKEMWNRFTIPLVRLDSNRIQKIRASLPSNYNPFFYYDKTIVSIDTLKRDVEYRTHLENAYWDIIVIDEAQNVADRGDHQAQRSRLAKLLAERSDTMIMLSATPHDGRAKSFASLMNMLDPTAIANPEEYTKEDINGLCIRRFKEDVKDQVSGAFLERKVSLERCHASAREEYAFEIFSDMQLQMDVGRERGSSHLFKTSLEKSLFSSPAACIKSIDARLAKLNKRYGFDEIKDIRELETLRDALARIQPKDFSRYQQLLTLLKSSEYGWDSRAKDDRLVIFTERIETMKYLAEHLREDLSIPATAIQEISGGMSDAQQQEIVENFGRTESPIRVLVASDVASEGLNLHYLSHRMIHFDIPWSLMVFQQRNGRIDRYGQQKRPDIRYMMIESDNKRIKGDMRIIEILITKEEQALKNIGDPALLLGKFTIEDEELVVIDAIENGADADAFEEILDNGEEEFDPFEELMRGAEEAEEERTEQSKTVSDWMRKAVENGDEDAPEQLAAYEKTAADAKDALAGDSQAQADYAKFLMQAGNSTEQPEKDLNYAECVKWAQKAADQGNADGMWIMGLAYEHGRGVAQNSSKAVEYYQQGAELGNDQAMNSYAAYISRGNVPRKTAKDAFELIKKAAEKGNVLAMRNLGHCYQFEEGTHHDMQQAIFWYEKYLEHEEDEELARKVMIFKMMPDITDDSFESDDEYEKVDPGTFTKDLVRIEFKDKIFVLTGFDTREENKITSIISERGGIIKSSTVLKTDYLVVRGDYSSRKYERAVELNQKGKNIAIISSEQFYDLLD